VGHVEGGGVVSTALIFLILVFIALLGHRMAESHNELIRLLNDFATMVGEAIEMIEDGKE